jgi:GT2 family glycosyltransferase
MNTDELKILIAVPSMDTVAAGFAQSLATLHKVGQCSVRFVCGSLIYDARNKLAAQAIKMEADYIMWFDSDMVFEPDTLVRLLETAEKEDAHIVSGLYFRRSAPYTPVAFGTLEISDDKTEWTDYEGELTGVHKVGGAGFGCVLTDAQVILECFGKYGTCFSPIGHVGEDLSFLWRAKQLGYDTYLDCDVKCGHVGHVIVTEALYKAVKGDSYEG